MIDVFHNAFLATIVVNGGGKPKPRITLDSKEYLKELETGDIVLRSGGVDHPPGPHYLTGSSCEMYGSLKTTHLVDGW